MDITTTVWKDAMQQEGLTATPGHPAGAVDLTADLPTGDSVAASTLSTQPFFNCCG
ncbi:hypothetical protein AB0L50_31860 [Streptomyces flaveolus]|uniref:hypothetical protein n=1 Tax=Streptomyces TaxID=1883 RepID=UPI001301446C|nr:hypothetical protein [Streptomyces sp. CB02400]NUS90736.1 hypothetical protein [Streptomyces sp.]